MAMAISPRPITGKPDKRPRRALVRKNPTRTGVRPRRGKVIPKPNLSKYKHKAPSVVKDLSSSCDSESQSDYNNNTPRTTNLSSTPLSSLDYAQLTSPKTPNSKYSGRSGILKDKSVNQQKTAIGNFRSHLSARLLGNSSKGNNGDEYIPSTNRQHQRAGQSQIFARHAGTQNDPHILESDCESEVEHPPRSQLKTGRARFASHSNPRVKDELEGRYSNQRKRGQSRYCPPTSRKPGVKDVQDFIEDVASDAESVETFNGTDMESEDEKSDLSEEELAEELNDLNITMDDWGENKKRQRSLDTDTDTETDTDVNVCPHRNSTANNTKRKKATPSHSKSESKKARFEFSPEPMDDEEDLFTLYAVKQRNVAVKSKVTTASRQIQKDCTTTSPSPTPSPLSPSFSLPNSDVPIVSVEPTDREVRL